MRASYAWGYKSRAAAEEALEDLYAFDEVSDASRPKISSYKTEAGTRWQITLDEG